MIRRLQSQKLMPWHMAIARRQIMAFWLAPALFTLTFMETWAEVYREPV